MLGSFSMLNPAEIFFFEVRGVGLPFAIDWEDPPPCNSGILGIY